MLQNNYSKFATINYHLLSYDWVAFVKVSKKYIETPSYKFLSGP